MEPNSNVDLKRNPFTVPEGYFERLATDIRLNVDRPAPTRSIRLWPSVALAASLALAGWIFWPNSTPVEAEQILAEISDDQLAQYVSELELLVREDILQPSEQIHWTETDLILDSL